MKKNKKNNVEIIETFFSKQFNKIFKNNRNTIIFISLLSLISCLFLLKSGIIKGHDLEYHLSRISAISNCLKNGDLKALIHDGFYGYGYANGLFYSNLFLYFPAFLNSLGINVIVCYKIFLVLCTLLTTYSMYFCVKRISKSNSIAAIASLLFVFCSYRICDVMVRAAVGEILSFIFIPIIILGLYEIIFGDYKKFYIFSLGFVGLVNCHLISTVFMFIIIVLICIFNLSNFINEPKRFQYLIFSGILGLLLGAFFIFPLLEQYFRSDLLITTQKESAVSTMPFLRLFSGIFNFKSHFIPGGVGFIYLYAIYKRTQLKKKTSLLQFSDFCMIVGLAALLACSDFLPWNELSKVLGSIQFTWRLLFVSSAFLSISAAIIFYESFQSANHFNISMVIILLYVILICVINQILGYDSLKTYYGNKNVEYLKNYNDFSIASGEYLPSKTDWSLIATDKRELKTNNGDITFHLSKKKDKYYIQFENNTGTDTYIDVPLIYYYGYRAKSINHNNYYSLNYGYNTWIRVYINDVKEDQIVVWYKGTKIERLSCIISILSWILFIYYYKKNKGTN